MTEDQSHAKHGATASLAPVVLLGILLLACIAATARLAQSFPYEIAPNRPIIGVVVIAWIASVISLVAVYFGLRSGGQQRKLLVLTIFLFAIAFRVILIFSNPILEVDFYRYLWDGITANQGVSPYRFSPDAVLHGVSNDPQLARLQAHVERIPSAQAIVSRVHFEEYTSLYPPVSQFMFRVTTALIPDGASVWVHIVCIKSMLVLFDVGVIACLAWLLGVLGKHPAWLMAYAWSPLVLKEIANGGHLDSIAVFFFTCGVALFLWSIRNQARITANGSEQFRVPFPGILCSGVLLGLGIGAKLFPVVIVPVLVVFLWKKSGAFHAILLAMACGMFAALTLWPMIKQKAENSNSTRVAQVTPMGKTADGLAAFMSQWRMNDAIFSFVYQNVEYDWGDKDPAWYVFVSNETRIQWCKGLANNELANGNPAYFVARIVTVILFGLFYLWALFRVFKIDSAVELASHLFLIMGVFFFLQPTQNPWYWLWTMPLVCFAKNRGWLFVSMALFTYYLRFWFDETNHTYKFLDANYVGTDFYDHCVVWLEFATVLGVLFAARIVSFSNRAK